MILKDKVVLVTGGTGSLGKTLVKRILSGDQGTPKKLIVLSRDEGKQHDMRLSYLHSEFSTDEVIYNNFKNLLEFRIGDVRSYSDVCSALKVSDFVINAAALKQVPTCEYFPEQAILTNCLGAANIVRAIQENDFAVQTVVGISTDKACKPVNAMGMTKSLQERIFISANILNPQTRFLCVRYGNVLASRGSVIPLFHQQIKTGKDITVTDTRMTRFLLSLDQAVDTVFAALRVGKAGEIIVPRVPACLITNVAKSLVGNRKININITGIRPGEKLHEIMISEEEAPYVEERENYYTIRPMLPELNAEGICKKMTLDKEYSSSQVVLNEVETLSLLKKHKLLVEDQNYLSTQEFLR